MIVCSVPDSKHGKIFRENWNFSAGQVEHIPAKLEKWDPFDLRGNRFFGDCGFIGRVPEGSESP
jgi:hypothetical protein